MRVTGSEAGSFHQRQLGEAHRQQQSVIRNVNGVQLELAGRVTVNAIRRVVTSWMIYVPTSQLADVEVGLRCFHTGTARCGTAPRVRCRTVPRAAPDPV